MTVFGIICAAMAIWALVDIFKSKKPTDKKVLWFIIVILFLFIGPIVYYFVGRK